MKLDSTSLLVPLTDFTHHLASARRALPATSNPSEYVDAIPFEQVASLEIVRVRRESKQRRLDETLSEEAHAETKAATIEAKRLAKLAKRVRRETLTAEDAYGELVATDVNRPRLAVFISQLGSHEVRHDGEVLSSAEGGARGSSISFDGGTIVEIDAKVTGANFGAKTSSIQIEGAPSNHRLLQDLYVQNAKELEVAVSNDTDMACLCAAMTITTLIRLRVLVDLKVTSKSLLPTARLVSVSNVEIVMRSLNEFVQRTLHLSGHLS